MSFEEKSSVKRDRVDVEKTNKRNNLVLKRYEKDFYNQDVYETPSSYYTIL